MLEQAQIRNISNVAAYRAAEEGKVPLAIWTRADAHNIPFLGEYVPAGYRRATWADLPNARTWQDPDDYVEVMVDSSGFGADDELAMTFTRFADLIMADGQYWAVISAGEFQVYAAAYVQDDDAPAQNLPDEADVTCENCGIVHNDLEECFEYDEYDYGEDE